MHSKHQNLNSEILQPILIHFVCLCLSLHVTCDQVVQFDSLNHNCGFIGKVLSIHLLLLGDQSLDNRVWR